MAFDVEAVRAEFPILQRQVNGHPLVYLDSAASAQKPQAVISAMSRAMETSYANVHRGLHTLANETTEAFEQARASVARFIGAETDEVVFTKGATEAINLVAAGVGARLQAGDEILLTQMEHHANIGPRTRVVAFSHMSNVLGTINPAAEIIAMAKAAGALTLVDGCQAVVHQMVDVKALDANFYVFSGHKLYGPTGIGVLYGKRERLEELPPYQGGGEMIATVTEDAITYADSPHRFEAGTPAIIEAIGLGAAIEWLNGLDRPAIAAHESALYARVLDQLSGANWLRVIGEAPGKGAILSFTMEGAHAHDVAQILDRYGVAVRAGAHCAEPLMRRFGVTSSARASFGLYNTEAEADAFAAALFKTQTFFG